MSGAQATGIPNSQFAATVLKRMISTQSPGDPTAADLARLAKPILEIALAVLMEGPDKARRSRRLRAELTARGLDPLAAEVERADSSVDLSTLQVSDGWVGFDLADVVKQDLPAVRWLVKPYIWRPGVFVFFGRAKSLKSMLTLDLCLHVSGGHQWLTDPTGAGGFQVTQGKVVWVDMENGSLTFRRRLKALAKPLAIGELRGQFIGFSMPRPIPDLSAAADTEGLIDRLQSIGDVSILVLDHLNLVFGVVDENSSMASLVMNNVRLVAETCDCAVIAVHHSKKGGGKDGGEPGDALRGSGAIMAALDAAILVERDKTDPSQVRLLPVAARASEPPKASAQFSYERDANLDLTEASFWQLQWRTAHTRAMDAVLKALRTGPKNHTALRSAAKAIESGISDQVIRDAIASLEGVKDIIYTKGEKGSKIYRLTEQNEDEPD
jgi:hypothetical protein